MKYGFSKTINLPFDEAVEKVTSELKKEGFGVLTTIDVRETMKNKLNIDFPKYKILGACNPSLAHKALTSEIEIGLLLPCNLIIYQDNDDIRLGVFDPMVIPAITGNSEMNKMASEVKVKLERVFASV